MVEHEKSAINQAMGCSDNQIQPNIILTMFHHKPTPRWLNFINKSL